MKSILDVKRRLAAARCPYPVSLMDDLEEAYEENERLRATVEGLEASKEIEIECHVQSCLDYQTQIQTLNDENQSLRRSLTREAVKDAKYNAEIMRLRKELEDTKLQRDTANESKEYAKAEYLDQCRANGELRKELEEAQKQSAKWEKAFDNADKQYLKKEQEAAVLRRRLNTTEYGLNCISMGEWACTHDEQGLEVWTTRRINPGRIAREALAVGQEGEGNQ